MIVLDASVLIAHAVDGDPHASASFEILDTDDELAIHPVNLAECLVGPARIGVESAALDRIDRLGVERDVPTPDEPLELARLRARTGLKLPDCCVLVVAIRHQATLATFDARLAHAARELGLAVVGS